MTYYPILVSELDNPDMSNYYLINDEGKLDSNHCATIPFMNDMIKQRGIKDDVSTDMPKELLKLVKEKIDTKKYIITQVKELDLN